MIFGVEIHQSVSNLRVCYWLARFDKTEYYRVSLSYFQVAGL